MGIGRFSQVEGLAKDKKLEILIDADLRGDYVKEEVDELIQIALLCTQRTPKKRPKMAEVVRMLDSGNGLAEKWEEWQTKEMFRQEFKPSPNPGFDLIVDSAFNLTSEELSGPR